jgi:hypothetical protein
MASSKSDSFGAIIQEFLLRPLNRKAFDAFFRLCYQHTIGYVRFLTAKGYRFPLEPKVGGDPISDLAIDILGTLLHSTKDQSFPVVFSYFRKVGVTDPGRADPTKLYDHFTVLIRGHIRQEIFRLVGQYDPQIDHLKRRFKEILKGPDFTTIKTNPDSAEIVFLSGNAKALRRDERAVSYDELLAIAEQTYSMDQPRSQWCRRIFELLDENENAQNFVKKHELLSAVVAVNLKYIDADGLLPTCLPSPEGDFTIKAAEKAMEQTLVWLEEAVLKELVRKGRLTENEAEKFKTAALWYLSDLIYSGQTDPIPQYFREAMPEDTHQRFLKDYKYLFETTLNKAFEYFQVRLE